MMAGPQLTTLKIPLAPIIGAIVACVIIVSLIGVFVYLYAVKYRNKKVSDVEEGRRRDSMFLSHIRDHVIEKPAEAMVVVRHVDAPRSPVKDEKELPPRPSMWARD
jgi:hypothetical protein